MKPGETFLGFDLDDHLWIILSGHDTNGLVAVANLTTHGRSAICARGACTLVAPGEHKFVRRESCIYYRGATLTSGESLDRTKQRGTLHQSDSLSPELLARVQVGALESEFVAVEVQDAIRDSQGGASE